MLTEEATKFLAEKVREEYDDDELVKMNLDGPVPETEIIAPVEHTHVIENPSPEQIESGEPFVCPECRWAMRCLAREIDYASCTHCDFTVLEDGRLNYP